jgi:uridylate kinase
MKIVIDIGGSVLCSEGFPNSGYVKRLSKMLVDLKEKGHTIVIVTGGGKLARTYANVGRELEASEAYLDMVGIAATRMNAQILIAALGEHAYMNPVTSFEELGQVLNYGKIIVLGGLIPGQTTNAVAIEVAEYINAAIFIKATDVKGIHTKDPKKHKSAKLLKTITTKQMLNISMEGDFLAGKTSIMDPVAAKLMMRLIAKKIILDAHDIENMRSAAEGKAFIGTEVV